MNPATTDHETLAGLPILVTGATGKIGNTLVSRLLDRGAQVRVLTRYPEQARSLWPAHPVTSCRGDITQPETLPPALRGSRCVFHLASHSPSRSEPNIYEAPDHWPVTAEGTANLVAAALAAGVERLIYLSSVKAMGDGAAAQGSPADETTPPAPETLYGRAKLAAERSVLAAGHSRRMHVCVLRLPMVYGLAGMGNIARMIEAVARNRFPPWPKIENRRVAIHVDDAVRAAILTACAPHAAGQVYLVTDGKTYSTRWIYEQIRLALGRPPPRWSAPVWALRAVAGVGSLAEQLTGYRLPLNNTGLEKLTGDAWFSARKISQELEFKPQHDLESEIPRMVRDYLHKGLR